jgi:Rieske oxygenase family protein
MRCAAIPKTVQDPDKEKYVRVTLFLAPCTGAIPRPLGKNLSAHIQIFAPMDDKNAMSYRIFFSQDHLPVSTEETVKKVVEKANGFG